MPPTDPTLIERGFLLLQALTPGQAIAVVFVALLLCGLGLPMPEDVILIAAGYLASLGKFSLAFGIVAGMMGVLAGDAMLFFLGRRLRHRVFDLPWIRRWVTDEQIEAAKQRVRENGRFICFIARFLPGLRSPIYLTAGVMGIKPRVYLMQDGLAAAISVPFWVVIGWWFGPQVEAALRTARHVQTWILAAMAVAAIVLFVRWWRRRGE